MNQTPRQRFAAALASGEMIVAPGCYDGLTARLIERAGFRACYMTGAGTAASFGLPDFGLLTATEMIANAARIAAAVDIPVIADADTGFGNELNVTRAVRDYERAGIAAIHVEDQDFPKKCGHLDDKEVIPLDRYLSKIRAAAAARTDPDFKIIAHVVFRKARDLSKVILPIDFAETKAAMAQNIQTRKDALKYLEQDGCIGIFPSGAVATAPKPFGKAMDPVWKTFTARMIARSDAQVVPMFFEGTNSRLFQIAGHLNQTLRTALLISEFDSRVNTPLRVSIGEPLPRSEIDKRARDGRALINYLREETYKLSPWGEQRYPDGLYLG